MVQGSPFLFRAHWNYSVVVVIWAFAVSSFWPRLVIGVTCYRIWGTHALKRFFTFSPFQSVISWYERFTSLPFFRHLPRDEQQCVSKKNPDGPIVFSVQALLDAYATCFEPLWTLWALWILGEHRFCVVRPSRGRSAWWRHPCLVVFFPTKNMFFVQ